MAASQPIHLELFFGYASPAETRVYARLPGEAGEGIRLSGILRGPFCEYAQTLPASIPLVDQGPGKTPLAQAIVPDPCFWTPDMPYLYSVHVEGRDGNERIAEFDGWLGIRPLGVSGRGVRFEGKNWVLRGLRQDEAPQAELPQWHETGLAMLVEEPSEALCEEASRLGVLLMARLSGSAERIEGVLQRLGRWAAVGLAVLEPREPLERTIRSAARNLLLGQRFAARQEVEPAGWAQFALCEMVDAQELAGRLTHCNVPLFVQRSAGPQSSLSEARARCDRLQRDLAGVTEVAGYLV